MSGSSSDATDQSSSSASAAEGECPGCAALRRQLRLADLDNKAAQIGSQTMRLELDAAETRGGRNERLAHVDALTMRNELDSAEQQLTDANALTHDTIARARQAEAEADVRQAIVVAELPVAESGGRQAAQPPAAPVSRAAVHESFARLSAAIEEAQPHLQEQAYRELYEAAMACFNVVSLAPPAVPRLE